MKDIEWVSKKHEAVKKSLRGATGTANLADKAKKEELDCLTKVLDHLENGGKDVRKGEWTTKDVRLRISLLSSPSFEQQLRSSSSKYRLDTSTTSCCSLRNPSFTWQTCRNETTSAKRTSGSPRSSNGSTRTTPEIC